MEVRTRQSAEEFLTPDELAKKFKVDRSWVYRQVRETDLPRIKCGKYLRFRLSDVLAYLER